MKIFKSRQADTPRRRLVDESADGQGDARHASHSNIFKRNRTLTGTTSNSFSSAASVKTDMESSRMHVHHLTTKRRKILGLFGVVLLSSMLLWTLVSNLTARVSVSVSDTAISKVIDKSIYENVIQDYLDDNPLSRLSFFLDQSSLNNYVAQKSPEVLSVAQSGMLNFGETEFMIQMRNPVAGWSISGKQYYVDSRGVSFENNYYIEPSVQIIDKSGADMGTGTTIVSHRLLSFVGRVVAVSKNYGHTVTEAILPPDTTRELDLKINGISYYAKLSIDRSVGEQVEDMSRSINYFKANGINPEYIDVRVSGKAFYK